MTIGYKVFDKQMKCGDFKYKVGKTYTQKESEPYGFTFITQFDHIFDNAERLASVTRVAEVEVIGQVSATNVSKYLKMTSCIRIVREISFAEIKMTEQLIGVFKEFVLEKFQDDIEEAEEKYNELLQRIMSMSDRDKKVLFYRSNLGGAQLSLGEISDKLGISRERVRQIEAKSIKMMLQLDYSKKNYHINSSVRENLYNDKGK